MSVYKQDWLCWVGFRFLDDFCHSSQRLGSGRGGIEPTHSKSASLSIVYDVVSRVSRGILLKAAISQPAADSFPSPRKELVGSGVIWHDREHTEASVGDGEPAKRKRTQKE